MVLNFIFGLESGGYGKSGVFGGLTRFVANWESGLMGWWTERL